MRRLLLCLLSVLVVAAPASAVQNDVAVAPAQESKPGQPPQKPAPAAEAKQETPKAAIPTDSHARVLANVRLEITITDQRASGPATSKTVSLVLADRAPGRIRTAGDVSVHGQIRHVILNVDASPEFTRDGRVRAHVTLEYRPVAGEAPSEDQALTAISETFAVILEDGKPLVVSQSADPSTDRRVRVEVKATILK